MHRRPHKNRRANENYIRPVAIMAHGRSELSIVYPAGFLGGFKGSRVCKKCGAKVVGTDPINLSINYAAHMRLHEPR